MTEHADYQGLPLCWSASKRESATADEIAATGWTLGQSDRFVDCYACDDEIQRIGLAHIEAGQAPDCWIWFAYEARPVLRPYAGNLELWLVSRRGAVKAVDLPMTEGVCAMLREAMAPARPPVDMEDLPF